MMRFFATLALLLGASLFAVTPASEAIPAGPDVKAASGAGKADAQRGLTRCQKEFAYSVSLQKPRKEFSSAQGGQARAWGRLTIWDNDFDYCFIKFCMQSRNPQGNWAPAQACMQEQVKYEGEPTPVQSTIPLYWWPCNEVTAAGDQGRSWVAIVTNGQVGPGKVGPEVDVCPNNSDG